jgi:2',3'-cyclic-nucleotide 2'-phosphodiesterase (5'-nucleotidase family)
MGDMTADAFLWARTSIGAHVDAAMHNSGGIRNGVSAPNVTMGSIATAFPFTPGELVDIVLTGKELWDVIEGTVSKVNTAGKVVTAGLQVSGMRVSPTRRLDQATVSDPTRPPASSLTTRRTRRDCV